jgi:nitroreductase
MINRRTALRVGGGALALTTVAGVARAIDQGLIIPRDRPGLAAWDDWNQRRYTEELALVSAGILAASPHNTQPWRFAIGREGVDIFEVPERHLGAMDPFGRERLAGLGAAILNMSLATTGIDRASVIRLLPDPANPVHAARVALGSDGSAMAPHPLLPVIGRRHTDRGPWTGAPPGDLAGIAATAGHPAIRIALFEAASPRGRRFAELTIDATAAIASDAEMMAASHAWFRHSRRDQDRYMDGLGLGTSGVSPFIATMGAILPDQSPASEGRFWLQSTRETALPSASVFGLILAADPHDRRTALLAGMAWQRLHLTAVARGLAAQPLNQVPEMIDRERQLGAKPGFARAADALLDDPAWRPTFSFRLGTTQRAAMASPRRPVSLVIGAPARLQYDVDQARALTEAQDAALVRRGKSGGGP